MARNLRRSRPEGDAAHSRAPLPSLDELAAEQGVEPVANVDDLYGDFWPEDESVDDFIDALRRWRRGDDTDPGS